MKKLLSICFLSILLGLMSFSAKAQCGFWMENLQPDVLTAVANSGNPDGTYALNHTLGNAVLLQGQNNRYLGNVGQDVLAVNGGATQLYELHICPCDEYAGKKVSIDWQLERRNDVTGAWEIVNDNLSNYAEFGIYTLYPQINAYNGNCESIQWLGGIVPNTFGYCNEPGPYNLLDTIMGLPCNGAPTNYPGALHVDNVSLTNVPGSVLANVSNGQITDAMGTVHLYSQGFDYFYYDFLASTRNIVTIQWKQSGDYRLTMRIRERTGGTDWYNAQWGGDELAHIGGHQSCCGPVLMEDMIHYPLFDTLNMEVCMGTTVEMGGPAPETFIFGETLKDITDTTLLLGNFVGTGACQYIDINTIRNVSFYLRHVPVLEAEDVSICRCDPFTVESLKALVHPDLNGLTDNDSYKIQWQVGPFWLDEPNLPSLALPGDYDFTVRQVNTYNDTLDCISEPVTFTVTVEPIHSPFVTVGNVDFCLEAIDATTLFTAVSEPDENCATTTRWYTTLADPDDYYWMEHYPYWRQTSSILASSLLAGQGNELSVNLIDYIPFINKDTAIYFFATSYNEETNCESPRFAYVKVYLHQTPVLTATPMDSMFCPGSDVTMEVTITNNPFNVDPQYNYYWSTENTQVLVGDPYYYMDNPYVPLYNYYNYSYSQQLIHKSELTAGTINSISFGVFSNPEPRNIEIWLSYTDQESIFSWNTEDNKVLVYSGVYPFQVAWNEIELTNPFSYDALHNLLVTVIDKTGTWSANPMVFLSEYEYYPSHTGMTCRDENPFEINYDGEGYSDYRNIMIFNIAPSQISGDNYSNYTQHLTTKCDSNYVTTVRVSDANGCLSAPVEFHYFTGDTVNPTITPATFTANINACEIAEEVIPVYTDIDDLVEAFDLTIADNCDPDLVTLVGHEDTWTIDSCQQNIVRVYTVQDACGNTATFTQNVTSRDENAPEFALERPLRIDPIPAGNCTFNAPSYEELVAAIAPYVTDDCADAEFLLSDISFVWENTDIDPSGEEDIFRVKTHLTINATITDKCGNTTTEGVFFLDRPDTLKIDYPSMIAIPGTVCFGDTVHLVFRPSQIVDDTVMGPFVPYTFNWVVNEQNVDNVTFLSPNSVKSDVVFSAPGDYEFQMVVTDNNGCQAVSESRYVHVVTPPVLVINPVPADVEIPLCPTYGNLTIQASLVDPEYGQNLNNSYFEWVGESVNEASHESSTFIHIIPIYCDTLYHATVTTTDNHGCPATAEYSVRAQAKTPTFVGNIPDYTLAPQQPDCRLVVPSFKDVITGAMIDDPCYGFYEMNGIGIKYTRKNIGGEDVLVENLIVNGADYDWYTQVPAMDEIVYGDTVVTITITNPCGATMTTTVNLKKPNDYITVTIPNPTAAVCQDVIDEGNGVSFTAVASVTGATYEWTEADDEDEVIETGATLTIVDTLLDAGDDYMNYYYVVTATDGQGCKAQATATLTVYYQGDDIDYRVWPNTMCVRNNGIIAIDTVPTGYAVILVSRDDDSYGPVLKYSDVPAHETTNWNTIYFDSLAAGWYNATVINLHGCERTIDIEVLDNIVIDDDFDYETTLAYCNGLGATIEVNEEDGYVYFLEKMMHNVWTMLDIYEGVEMFPVGYYRLSKMNIETRCVSYSEPFIIGKEESELTFQAVATPRTTCYVGPNPSLFNEAYDGTITISTTGLKYRVTNQTTGAIIYNHIDGTYAPITDPISITGLNIGEYYIEALDPQTGCMADMTVEVEDARVYPDFTVSTTPNNACKAEFNNGTITFDPATTYTYYVDGSVRTATWLTSRPEGDYHVYAVAANTNCRKDTTVTIDVDTYNPIVTVADIHNNASCDPDVMAYNGGADFEVTGTCNYTFKLYDNWGDGWDGHQYADGYINVTIEQAGFTKTFTFEQGNEFTQVVQLISGVPATITYVPDYWGEDDEEYYELYSPSNNLVLTRYAFDGADVTDFTPNCPVAANQTFNTYIKPYRIDVEQNGVTVASVTNQTSHNASITGLNAGEYTFTVTSAFGCEYEGNFIVGQDNIPEMELAQLPDHYCAPMSATKPGDGQVIIVSPIAEPGETDHFYEYKFFDESWNEMEVPYNLPMTHIMYWMASGLYHVQAYDTVTGCMVEGSIEVEKAPYLFNIDVEKTPTTYCSETSGNGTVTFTVTSTNADAVFAYYHENEINYTGYFEHLAMGDHNFTIKDVLTGCDTDITVKITADTCRPTFTITDGEHVNGGFVYCIYDADVTLHGSADSECDDHFSYKWEAPCSDINFSNTADILVDIDHVMPNGCTYIFTATDQITGCIYDTTVLVSIHERPQFYFTINQLPVPTTVSNLYCEQEDLLIAVVPEQGYVIKENGYEWTLGYYGTDSSFHFMGEDTILNAITFCVRVTDTNNCRSNIGSLPVSFNRVQHLTQVDVACDSIIIAGIKYTYLQNGTHFFVEETRYSNNMSVTHACDTIVMHDVTLYRQPAIDFEATLEPFMDVICEDAFDTVVAAMYDAVSENLVPTGDSCTVQLKLKTNNGLVDINASYALTYADSNLMFVVTPSYDGCDALVYDFDLNLGLKPVIDSFELAALYCNGKDTSLTVIVTNQNPTIALVTLTLPDGNVLSAATVPARTENAHVTFDFTPWNTTYNVGTDSLVKLAVFNSCGFDKDSLKISVDTTLPRHLDTIRVCEGDTFFFALVDGIQGYDVQEARMQLDGNEFISITDSTIVLTDTTKVFFTLTNDCGNTVPTDTAVVCVKPLPKIFADQIDHWDLCVETAAEDLENLVEVADATDSGWVLRNVDGTYTDPMTIDELIDTAKKVNNIDIYYYAANENGCGDSVRYIGNIRILMPLTITVPDVTICPNEKYMFTIVTAAANGIIRNHNNYTEQEVETIYQIQNPDHTNWYSVDLTDLTELPIETGDVVRVIYAPIDDLCEHAAVGYIHVTLYDTSYTEATMKEACEGSAFADFIETEPSWDGDAILAVDGSYWTVLDQNQDFVRFDNMDTVFEYSPNSPVYVQYVWNTQCGPFTTPVYELEFLINPSVVITDDALIAGDVYDTLPVCLNSLATEIEFDVTDPSLIATDTTWTIGGVAFEPGYQFTMDDNNKMLIVTVNSECESAADTVIVKVNPLPVPTATGDDVICTNGSVTLNVVDPVDNYTYSWVFEDETVAQGTTALVVFTNNEDGTETINIEGHEVTVDQALFYYFTLVATDNNTGCVSNSMINASNDAYFEDVISIKSTDAPQFIFKYQGNETHRIEGLTTGNQTEYTWEVSNECGRGDKLVFVEYTIYHNGEVINPDSLGNYFLTQTSNTNAWITRNHITWKNSQQVTQHATGYFNSSIPGFEDPITGAQSGNHFPNQDMAFGNNQQFDDVFMHFLNKNAVDKTIAPFVNNGEYKIVYRLIATDYQSTYQHLYWNADSATTLRIGGHQAYSGDFDTLAVDSIFLIVGGDALAVVENPVAPEMAPAISTDENIIVPEMEVWPNPAPAIVTTFKARVYNMRGEANVTITNFAGKQVYSGDINIDRDGYYFEADVNSLAVGAYIMTVRTKDAVISKKLVVTVRQ